MRALLDRPGLKLGTYITEFATPGIGRILAAAQCDFAFVDMEHSGFGFDPVRQVLENLHGANVGSLVRVPADTRSFLQRAADIGAQGVIVPMVNSADQARAAVAAVKYPPDGTRGVALGLAHDAYERAPVAETLARANRNMCFVALIETAEGVANCEAICEVPGVDAVWIGHLDLSASLGIPGAFDDPRFEEAVARIVEAAATAGILVGQLVGSPEEAVVKHRRGTDLICYSGDAWLLRDALTTGLARIRAEVESA